MLWWICLILTKQNYCNKTTQIKKLKQKNQTQEMNLQQLEKQRIKLYRQYLKKQIQKNSNIRKQQNSYQRKKQLTNMNQLIDKLNLEDIRRIEQRRNMAIMLKEQNSQLSCLKKSGIHKADYSQEQTQLKNNSFVDAINMQDQQRVTKLKQIHANTYLDNEAHQNDIKERVKQIQKRDQQRHLKRLRQMQQQSQRNYEQIKQKHSQNMNLYQMHSQLMQQNEQYRKETERFTECSDDIISRLKRNQSAQRRRNYMNNQSIIKNQMNEYRQRRSLQKSHILEGNDIDESIFKNLLHGSPDHKKWYGEQLRSQMSQLQTKKSEQKLIMKEVYKINGLFGGEHGKERQAQIRYVDRKLGINPSMDLNKKNEQKDKKIFKNGYKSYLTNYNSLNLNTSEQESQKQQIIISPSNQNRYQQDIRTKTNEKKQIHVIIPSPPLSMPNIKKNISTKDPIQNYYPTNDINSEPTYNEVIIGQNLRNFSPKSNRNIENGIRLGKKEEGGIKGENNPQRKVFRSFDVVSGQAKFYG